MGRRSSISPISDEVLHRAEHDSEHQRRGSQQGDEAPERVAENDAREEADPGDQEDHWRNQGSNAPAEFTDHVSADEEHHQDGRSRCHHREAAHEVLVVMGVRILQLQLPFPGHFDEVDRDAVADYEDRQTADIGRSRQEEETFFDRHLRFFFLGLFHFVRIEEARIGQDLFIDPPVDRHDKKRKRSLRRSRCS